MERWKKLGKNVLLMSIGSIGTKFLTFLLIPLYTSALSTQDYGISDLLITTVSLLMPIFTLTIREAVLRFSLDKDTDKHQVFTIGIMVNVVGFAALLSVSQILLLIPLLKSYYIYFLLYYSSFSIYESLSGFTNGIGKVGVYTVASICQTVLLIISNVVCLLYLNYGIRGYLISFILSYFGASAILLIFGHEYRYITRLGNIDKDILKNMLRYSMPMIPNTLSWWVSNSSDKYILTAISGAAINGLYSVAYKLPTILSVFYGIFMSAWRLSAVDDFGSQDSKCFFSSVYRKMEAGMFIVAAGIILFNKLLSHMLYANEFYAAKLYVPVLVLAFLFHGLSEFYGSIYTSARKTNLLFYSSIIGAVCNIIFNIILIPLLSGIGAAIATLLSYFVIYIFRSIHSGKIMKMTLNYRHTTASLILLTIMCVIQTIDVEFVFIYNLLLFLLILISERNTLKEIIAPLVKKFRP